MVTVREGDKASPVWKRSSLKVDSYEIAVMSHEMMARVVEAAVFAIHANDRRAAFTMGPMYPRLGSIHMLLRGFCAP